jgi:hypothetical protein
MPSFSQYTIHFPRKFLEHETPDLGIAALLERRYGGVPRQITSRECEDKHGSKDR